MKLCPVSCNLDKASDSSLDIIHRSLLLGLLLQLLDTSAPLLIWHTWATDRSLNVPHTCVDIDVLDLHVQRTVRRPNEPTVDLPDQVQEHEQRPSEVRDKEAFCVQITGGGADWIEGDVELSEKSDKVDEHADV